MRRQIDDSVAGVLLRYLCIAALLAPAFMLNLGNAQNPRACASVEHRQFDFWIGHWDVYGPAGKLVGTNRIEVIHDGCALLERWISSSGTTGTSLNTYDSATGQWHQFWVDNGGGRLSLTGGFVNGKMVLAGESAVAGKPGQINKERVSWELRDDGAIVQLWESSENGGSTWKTVFQGIYSRRDR
jgi:hypothetical protein